VNHQPNMKGPHCKEPKRAVCYLRVASSSDQDHAAIARQRTACEQLAQDLGLEVVGIYTDIGGPGAKANGNRPGLQRMLHDLETDDAVDVVLTQDHSRISRNMTSLQRILTKLQSIGVEVMTVNEPAFFHAINLLQWFMSKAASADRTERSKAGLAKRSQGRARQGQVAHD
jgi:DNA invertase Pin-like site-specific DNA recombinase